MHSHEFQVKGVPPPSSFISISRMPWSKVLLFSSTETTKSFSTSIAYLQCFSKKSSVCGGRRTYFWAVLRMMKHSRLPEFHLSGDTFLPFRISYDALGHLMEETRSCRSGGRSQVVTSLEIRGPHQRSRCGRWTAIKSWSYIEGTDVFMLLMSCESLSNVLRRIIIVDLLFMYVCRLVVT